MFGKDWTAARGTIVDRLVKASGSGSTTSENFIVDVVTSEGTTFRAQVDEPHIATDWKAPSIGMVVGVEYDPKSQKVRFDKDDPQMSWKHAKQAQKAAFEERLTQAPGTAPAQDMPMAPTVLGGLDPSQLQALFQASANATGQPQVIAMDPASPEAIELRAAVLRALGGAAPQAATPETPTPEA